MQTGLAKNVKFMNSLSFGKKGGNSTSKRVGSTDLPSSIDQSISQSPSAGVTSDRWGKFGHFSIFRIGKRIFGIVLLFERLRE